MLIDWTAVKLSAIGYLRTTDMLESMNSQAEYFTRRYPMGARWAFFDGYSFSVPDRQK
jgi:hypothetical protein